MCKNEVIRLFKKPSSTVSVVLTAVFLSLTGCGGGGSSSSSDNGQAMISLTDAAGDFLTYTVNVVSITLTKQDGTAVSTLPRTTRVDFTQLANLSELITSASVPAGNYKSVVMGLDYTNADIEVDNGTGTAVSAAVQDNSGNPITTLSVNLNLDNDHPLVIASGLPSQLEMDFNLAASNSVDMTNPNAPIVTVDPVLVASLSFDAAKPHRIRGPLASVNTSASTFSLFLRPFNLRQGNFGQVIITTDANTVFEINQSDYQGGTGLSQLAGEPATTATVALVTPSTSGQLLATEVYAGSSVPFGTSGVVSGNVVARTGDLLTVRGASLVRADGTMAFHETVLVQLGTNTKVTKEGVVATGLDENSISVGQDITAFGAWNSTSNTLDSTDPTRGPVRMLLTQLNGTAVSVSGQLLTMNLNRIDGRQISLFTFTGTGTPAADPTNYAVNVASGIDISSIVNGTPLKVRGFVAPFGQTTATDDFNGSTVINVTDGPADLVVLWPTAAHVTSPFIALTGTGMVVNLSQSGLVHDVYRSGVDTTLATTVTPTVNAQVPTEGLFVLSYRGAIQLYADLGAFQAALQTKLNSGEYARVFGAYGTYDDSTTTMTATSMLMVLK